MKFIVTLNASKLTDEERAHKDLYGTLSPNPHGLVPLGYDRRDERLLEDELPEHIEFQGQPK